MRWVYSIEFASGRKGTTTRTERVPDYLVYFRQRFGADKVAGVTERWGNDPEPYRERIRANKAAAESEKHLQALVDALENLVFPANEVMLHREEFSSLQRRQLARLLQLYDQIAEAAGAPGPGGEGLASARLEKVDAEVWVAW